MFYTPDVSHQSEIVTFLNALVTPNQWYATAFEYNVTGFGSVLPATVLGYGLFNSVYDSNLQQYLATLIDGGYVPQPTGSSYYAVFFPRVSDWRRPLSLSPPFPPFLWVCHVCLVHICRDLLCMTTPVAPR